MPNTSDSPNVRMRRKTATQWTAQNPILMLGQFGLETDTGKMKLGNGTDAWTALPYMDMDASDDGGGGGSYGGPLYNFEATYNASGIAAGEFRVNNATAGSITALFMHKTDAEGNSRAPSIALLSAGGTVRTMATADTTVEAGFKVTAITDSGTYYTLTGTFLDGVMPGDGSEIRVTVAPAEVTGGKRYVGELTQTGTDAPVVTPKVTDGSVLTFTYNDVGDYSWALTGSWSGPLIVHTSRPLSTAHTGTFAYGFDGEGTFRSFASDVPEEMGTFGTLLIVIEKPFS